ASPQPTATTDQCLVRPSIALRVGPTVSAATTSTTTALVLENLGRMPLADARFLLTPDPTVKSDVSFTLSGTRPTQVDGGYEWPLKPLAANESRTEELVLETQAGTADSMESLKVASTARGM